MKTVGDFEPYNRHESDAYLYVRASPTAQLINNIDTGMMEPGQLCS